MILTETDTTQCTTGASMVVGEMLAGPFLKQGYRIKLQMIVSMAGLTLLEILRDLPEKKFGHDKVPLHARGALTFAGLHRVLESGLDPRLQIAF